LNWRSDGYIVREKATKLSRGRSKGPAAAVGVGTPLWVRSRGSSVVNLGADGLAGGTQARGLLEHPEVLVTVLEAKGLSSVNNCPPLV